MKNPLPREHALFFVLLCTLAITLVARHINAEQFIYFWDWSTHFDRYALLGKTIDSDLMQGLALVWNSIRTSEYNFAAALLLQPFFELFGTQRIGFILGITAFFALPALLLFALCMKQLAKKSAGDNTGQAFVLGLLIVGTLPQFWTPTLSGYVGVLGLVPIAVILLVMLRSKFEELPAGWFPLIGLLLACSMVTRRWYAFWVVAFCLAFAVVAIGSCLPQIRRTAWLCARLALLGATTTAVFLALCAPVVVQILNTDYSDIYSAYQQSNSLQTHLRLAVEYWGPAQSLFALLGLFAGLYRKETRQFAAFIALLTTVLFLHFTNVQQFMVHHYLLLLPSIIVLEFIFFWELYQRAKHPWLRRGVIGFVALFGITHCLVVFEPIVSAQIRDGARIYTGFRSFPKTRSDLNEVYRLIDRLEQLAADPDDLVYILSGSFELNDDIVRNACTQRNPKSSLCRRVLATHQVDKRDGFPNHIFLTRYFVVTEPVGYSLRAEDQQLIGILAEQILSGTGLGAAFDDLGERFLLEHGVQTRIYKRLRPFEETALQDWSAKLRKSYAERADIYSFNHSCGLISGFIRGEGGGIAACEADFLYLVPGAESPTEISIAANQQYSQLSAKLGFRNVEMLPNHCPAGSGEVKVAIYGDSKELARYKLDYRQQLPIEFDIRGVTQLKLSVDKGDQGAECDWFAIRDLNMR